MLSLVMMPALAFRASTGMATVMLVDLPLFFLATVSLVNFYAVSQRAARPDWLAQLRYIPLALATGIGLSVNNTRAVLAALIGRDDVFTRTPKYGVVNQHDAWQTKRYRHPAMGQPLVELALGLYFTVGIVYAGAAGMFVTVPFLGLFQFGYLYLAVVSLVQRRRQVELAPAPSPPGAGPVREEALSEL